MYYLPLTLDTPAENLALDEALLNAAEAGEFDSGALRLWESPDYCVVLGRSSSAEVEVNLPACRETGVPVLRRSSGGGTILGGPGCLMYAVVLGFESYPHLQAIDEAHRFVLTRLASSLGLQVEGVQLAGTSDLVLEQSHARRKFSGNAMRRRRSHFLYHGTLLYDFDLSQIAKLLGAATRTPDYRQQRTHTEFVANLPIDRDSIVKALTNGWQANEQLTSWPQQRMNNLLKTKYTNDPKWVIHSPT